MITAFTGNLAEEVFNVLIVLLLSVQAPFIHRYRFRSTGSAPLSEKTQTIPIPTRHYYQKHFNAQRRRQNLSLLSSDQCFSKLVVLQLHTSLLHLMCAWLKSKVTQCHGPMTVLTHWWSCCQGYNHTSGPPAVSGMVASNETMASSLLNMTVSRPSVHSRCRYPFTSPPPHLQGLSSRFLTFSYFELRRLVLKRYSQMWLVKPCDSRFTS